MRPGFGDLPAVDRLLAEFRQQQRRTATLSWGTYSIWQYSESGPFTGDSNVWNGDYAGLRRFASTADYCVHGAIASAWAALGAGTANSATPRATRSAAWPDGGCYQSFQGGTIHYSPATGAFATWGAIRTAWGALGYENGKLGYPTSNEICGLTRRRLLPELPGRHHPLLPRHRRPATWGAIRAAWGAFGYENGKLGYPTSNEICGLRQTAAATRASRAAPSTTPPPPAPTPPGAPSAPPGAPWATKTANSATPPATKSAGSPDGGCYQSFQGGTIHCSPATGAHATWGAIRTAWGDLGYENGKLGYPTSNEICGLTGRRLLPGFQGGTIH